MVQVSSILMIEFYNFALAAFVNRFNQVNVFFFMFNLDFLSAHLSSVLNTPGENSLLISLVTAQRVLSSCSRSVCDDVYPFCSNKQS